MIHGATLRDIWVRSRGVIVKAVEAHHMNIRSAGLRTPAGPRLRTWV